jgi:hypothetical protein
LEGKKERRRKLERNEKTGRKQNPEKRGRDCVRMEYRNKRLEIDRKRREQRGKEWEKRGRWKGKNMASQRGKGEKMEGGKRIDARGRVQGETKRRAERTQWREGRQ